MAPGMLEWLRKLWTRREGPSDAGLRAFPAAWETTLRREVEFYPLIGPDQQARLRELMVTFVARKQWWGAENLAVTEEMKVIVAAYACLLVLEAPAFDLYPRTREIILYPREFGDRVQAIGPDGTAYDVEDLLLGETHYRGPVLLAWDSIKPPLKGRAASKRKDARITGVKPSPATAQGGVCSSGAEATAGPASRPPHAAEGQAPRAAKPPADVERESPAYGDVIIHEFAHALDSLDGHWDGTPPLGGDARLADWVRVFTQEYEALVRAALRGRRTFLDPYGAEDPTEFFAVATEAFFLEARRMKQQLPNLYAQLAALYAQDPATWQEG